MGRLLHRDSFFLNDFMVLAWEQRQLAANGIASTTTEASGQSKWGDSLDALDGGDLGTSREEHLRSFKVVRAFSEFAGAVEDFAALCSAIERRREALENKGGQSGILVQYLRTKGIDAFLASVARIDAATFSQRLGLPGTQLLRAAAAEGVVEAITRVYEHCSNVLRASAGVWLPTEGDVASRIDSKSQAPPVVEWGNHAHVLLRVHAGQSVGSTVPGPLLQAIFNKIKHRYAVVENPVPLIEADLASVEIKAQLFPKREVTEHLDRLADVCAAQQGLAKAILAMDRLGIDLM